MEEKRDVVTVEQAVEILGIGRTTLFTKFIKPGKLQPINRTKLLARPRQLLFNRADVIELKRKAEEAE
jgi:hypothetical protein